ncbi:MAG: hypothetical protein ACJ78Q_11570 [Chloroflexia bacterium]
MDTGEEQIEDSEMLRQIRRQALKVNVESVVAAAILTGLCLLIPA